MIRFGNVEIPSECPYCGNNQSRMYDSTITPRGAVVNVRFGCGADQKFDNGKVTVLAACPNAPPLQQEQTRDDR